MLGSKFPMFAAWGDELGFLYNDAYISVLGAKHPSALGKPFHDVWADIWSDISPLIAAALAGEASYFENLPLLMRRNGFDEQTWFTFSYSPVRDESGKVVGMFCACTETTDQVLSDRRLLEEKERQRRLFEKAPGFTAILSGPDMVFEFVNEAYSLLFSERDYIGRKVREVFFDLEGQGIFELLDNVYSTGERFVASAIPVRLQASQNEAPRELRLDFIYEPIRDDQGRITGIFAQGHDVTERTLAEEAVRASWQEREAAHAALEASEARLRALNADLERQVVERTQARGLTWLVSPDLLGALNSDGCFETANPAWQTVLGGPNTKLRTPPYGSSCIPTIWKRLGMFSGSPSWGSQPSNSPAGFAARTGATAGSPGSAFPKVDWCTAPVATSQTRRRKKLNSLSVLLNGTSCGRFQTTCSLGRTSRA
jgi:PAS domain-containing protein